MRARRRRKQAVRGAPGERWVIVTQYFPPEAGAAQVRLHALATSLRAQGVDVRVLTGMPNFPDGVVHEAYRRRVTARESIDGIDVRRLWLFAAAGRGRAPRLLNYLSFSFGATVYLLVCMRDVDVVFVESQPISLGVAGLSMKVIRGVPYVYNIPDLQTEAASQLGFLGEGSLLLRAASRLERLFIRESFTTSTVTRRFIDHFVARGSPRERFSYLPNGADTERLAPCAPDLGLARRLGVQDKKVFLYAGTHASYHGLHVVLDAAELLRHRPEVVFLFVGGGPEREALEARARAAALPNVVFGPRRFEYDELPAWMSISYAALVTLRDIPVAAKMRSAKVFPALACGVPVVHVGEGESADLVVEHACGRRVPPGDAEALARVVEQLADDPASRERMGASGRRLVEREYAWPVIVHEWIAELSARQDLVQHGVGEGDVRAAAGRHGGANPGPIGEEGRDSSRHVRLGAQIDEELV